MNAAPLPPPVPFIGSRNTRQAKTTRRDTTRWDGVVCKTVRNGGVGGIGIGPDRMRQTTSEQHIPRSILVGSRRD